MGWTAPGFRHIFYKLLANNNGKYVAVPTRDVPIAATDAKNILINPDTFFKEGLKERVFIAAHEIVHNVYGDVELLHRCNSSGLVPMADGTTIPFVNETMQKAMDFRINALLVDSKIGNMPDEGCYDLAIAGANDSVFDVYKKLYEDDQAGGKKPGFDQLLPPGASTGQNPGQASQQRNPQQWAVEIQVAQTLEQMKVQGKMAAALQRMFKELLEPEVPWTEHIQGIFNRKVGSGSYNWHRPNRRFIVQDIAMPSKSGNGAGWVVCWGDTSGSIGDGELSRYLGELSGIIDQCKPKRLTVVWCDAAISFVDELQDANDLIGIKSRGTGGGGGTSCQPVFDWIAAAQELPDVFLGLTDGHVRFPVQQPPYPVIWCSTTDKTYPWGDVVRLKV
jgi:predicted metal-dependent peptidase